MSASGYLVFDRSWTASIEPKGFEGVIGISVQKAYAGSSGGVAGKHQPIGRRAILYDGGRHPGRIASRVQGVDFTLQALQGIA